MPTTKNLVIIATNNPSVVDSVKARLHKEFEVDSATNKEICLHRLKQKRYEFIFIDVSLLMGKQGTKTNQEHYKNELSPFWQLYPTANIVAVSPLETIREAVYAVKAGANNYITFPIDPEEIQYVIENIQQEKLKLSELVYLRDRFWDKNVLDVTRTKSPVMKTVFDKVRSVAPTRTTVMLYGETGTGKGVIARLIHQHSNRKNNQFISVHCGAIPETLLESELFGHEKGAFTGAVKRKLGKFEIAQNGTIFLDEIGTISPAAQVKLLQVLQDRTFQRVGGEEEIEADARVIAASNMGLKEMCQEGKFRNDLYYRLNVFPIEIPPLRDRKDDILLLVENFLKNLNQLYPKKITTIHPLVMEAFQTYDWPGNIRELENLIERSYILETSSTLTPDSFPGELFAGDESVAQITLNPSHTLSEVRSRGIENIERQYLKEILILNKGRIDRTATHAGISTRQLHKLLTKYGIKKEDFR
ncbi:MAG: sigma-54-dependent Fis family transcriptional regulator [Desulfobacterales bacterium]|jgi:DNA-binding NtrC family response regulator